MRCLSKYFLLSIVTIACSGNIFAMDFLATAIPVVGSSSVLYSVSDESTNTLRGLGEGAGVNTLVEVYPEGVLIIDPGPSGVYEEAILKSVQRLHSSPIGSVQWIVNSVAFPELVLADGAKINRQAKIFASQETRQAMMRQCVACRQRLATVLGDEAIRRQALRFPGVIVKSRQLLPAPLGNWEVFLVPKGSAPTDLYLWNQHAQVLYAGGAVAMPGNAPDLRGSSLFAWINILKKMQALNPKYVIGMGEMRGQKGVDNIPSASAIDDTLQYLEAVKVLVQADFEGGGDPASADKRLLLPAYENLRGYQRLHPLNVQNAWQEYESQYGFIGKEHEHH